MIYLNIFDVFIMISFFGSVVAMRLGFMLGMIKLRAPAKECHSLEEVFQCCCEAQQPFHAFHVASATPDATATATVAVAGHPAVLDESSCQQLLLEVLQMLAMLLGIQESFLGLLCAENDQCDGRNMSKAS